ncbi:hypothetical protein Tco_1068323 [Tanacetum coccineum]|uniref:Uncharacterized protein n=1 Tax=Tanacetum coccineum TaxID=301880 RepID=A0ABQ5HGU9_9ASTR
MKHLSSYAINKEVDEGYKPLKVKLKTKQQPSPEALLLLNLKKQGKESKNQETLKEIKSKDTREGSGAAPESPDHNESDKSNFDEESDESDKFDKDSDNGDDQNEDFMKKHEPLPKSFPTQVPRLANLEQQNRADVIEELVQANVLNEVRNQLPKLLPKAVSNALKQTLVNLSWPTPTPSVDPSKYKLKHHLYEKMFQTATYLKHPKHRLLYDALQELMQIDELETRFGSTKPSHTKRTHNDQDLEDREGEKSKKRRKIGHEVQNNEIPSKHNSVWFQKSVEEHPVQSWFNKLVDPEEEPKDHEYKDGPVTYFGKLVKKIFIKDKIIKEDVYGVAFELLKGTCKNSIELEYNMDQCSLDLTDKIDWINPKGLKEWTYALSITKIKAARYKDEGTKEMILYLWSPSINKYNKDAKFRIYHWYPSPDFPFLNQNNIEDVYLMKIQNKIRNIKGIEEYDLVNALKMYIHRSVIKKRVKDVQMGVESYQTKLNLTKP